MMPLDPHSVENGIRAKTLEFLGLERGTRTPVDVNSNRKLRATVHTIATKYVAEHRAIECKRIQRLCQKWVQRNGKRIAPLDPDDAANEIASKTLGYLGLWTGSEAPFDLSDERKLDATIHTIGSRHVANSLKSHIRDRNRLSTVPLEESRDYPSSDSTPFQDMLDASIKQAIENATRQLPVELRNILMAYHSGRSLRSIAGDISEETGISVSHETVRARVVEAHTLIGASLRKRGLM